MGNCASNVTCIVTDQPIKSDIDVAGIGVLISFGATAVITFIAIVVGYLTDSLPDSTLTELDRAFIAQLQRRPWKSAGALGTLLQHSKATITGFVFPEFVTHDQKLDTAEKRKRDRARRSKGLERFVLALSDQQLVTGLAILVAGYTDRCSRSIYHFRIISALGWFSSTTHLSTLAVLRPYLIDHPRVRNWRVISMIAILGLLIVSQAGAISIQNSSLPIQCVYNSFAPYGLNPIATFILGWVIIFLCLIHTNRIRRLYTLDPDWSVQGRILELLTRPLIRKNNVHNLEKIVVTSSTLTRAEQGTTYRKLQQRRRWWRCCNGWVKHRSAISRRMVEFWYLNQEMQRSFLSEILTTLFGVGYGIAQVIATRNSVPKAGLSGDQNSISFGQLVPLLLIALPLLAAGEIYYGSDNAAESLLPSRKFVTLLEPASLLLLDDTDAAVCATLKTAIHSNSASQSERATNYQSRLLIPDASSGIPLSEMASSAVGQTTRNANVVAANNQAEQSSIAVNAPITEDGDDFPTIRRADTESGGHQMYPATRLSSPRAFSRKALLVLVMFMAQASYYIFFDFTMTGIGPRYLILIALMILVVGLAITILLRVASVVVRIKDGMRREET